MTTCVIFTGQLEYIEHLTKLCESKISTQRKHGKRLKWHQLHRSRYALVWIFVVLLLKKDICQF